MWTMTRLLDFESISIALPWRNISSLAIYFTSLRQRVEQEAAKWSLRCFVEKSLNRSVKVEHEKILFRYFFLTRTWKMISITPRIIHHKRCVYVEELSTAGSNELESGERNFVKETHRLMNQMEENRLMLLASHDVKCWKIILHFFISSSLLSPHIHFALLMSPFVSWKSS